MHGVPTEAVVFLVLMVLAASVVLGLAFCALALAAFDQRTEVIVGVVFVAGIAYLLAGVDPLEFGGNFAWRFVILAAALGGGCIASRAILRRQRASGRSQRLAIVIALGSLGFGTATVITLGLLLVISLTMAAER